MEVEIKWIERARGNLRIWEWSTGEYQPYKYEIVYLELYLRELRELEGGLYLLEEGGEYLYGLYLEEGGEYRYLLESFQTLREAIDAAVEHFLSQHPSHILNEDMTKLVPRLKLKTISDIMGSLRKHGCKDATSQLDVSTFGESPALSNLSRHFYTGELHQGDTVALKCVRLDLSSQEIMERELKRAAREVFIWSRCHHTNILPLIGMALFRNQFTMISPWMNHSNTRPLVAGQPREKRYNLCAQVIEGVDYLHTIGIAHGDLKADHVLLSGELDAHICGFGNARLIGGPEEFQNGHYNVSLNWAPPEMLQSTTQPNFASDVYSLGMTIYEFVSGLIPYAGSPESVIRKSILDCSIPERPQECLPAGEGPSDMLWLLLRSCWAKDPTTRPTSGEVKEKLAEILWETEDIVITRETPVADMIAHLGRRGCKNLGDDIDTEKCSRYPVSHGGLGDVYSGTLRDTTAVALKCLRPYHDQPDVAKKQFKRAARELYVWSKCNHPNVLGLIGLAEFRGQLAMVSPWMEHGSVRRFVASRLGFDRYGLCLQISDGVAYLHGVGVVHGDLKGDNVLVSKDLIPKLTDFGCAELREYTLQFSMTKTNASLSIPWAPPELFKAAPQKSPETDVYSLGMTILEVLTGSIPYQGIGQFEVIPMVMSGVQPNRPSVLTVGIKHTDMMWDLLESCWAMHPASRPSAAGVRDKIKEIIKERDAGK